MAPEAVQTVDLNLTGQLTAAVLEAALHDLGLRAPRGRLWMLLVDCSAMADYDVQARADFVRWLRKNRSRFPSIAVVTSNRLWHLVVATMALASSTSLKAFDSRSSAESWLAAQARVDPTS